MAEMLGPALDRNFIAAAAHARGAVEMEYTIAIGCDHPGLDILPVFLSTPYVGAAMISVWPGSPLLRGIR
jgi:hypothetical protein